MACGVNFPVGRRTRDVLSKKPVHPMRLPAKKQGFELVLTTLFMLSNMALAVDYEEFQELTQAAAAAHRALEGADATLLPALRENAVDRDLAVIAWLDAFFVSEAFASLPSEQQALAVQDRYRNEYNLARLLISLDRCEEARDRIRTLLDSTIDDAELRPHITEAFDDAIECINRPRTAILTVTCNPADAEILVDGQFVGLASSSFEVSLGAHVVVLRATGYADVELTFDAETEAAQIELGPVTLVVLEPTETDGGPEWYEWTLWGFGVAGITTSVVYYVNARQREDGIENPPDGFSIADEEQERGYVDDLDMFAAISGGLGLVCAIAGTVSYVVRSSGDDEPVDSEVTLSFGQGNLTGFGPMLSVRF